MKVLYFDMDGVLVDFQSGIDQLTPGELIEYSGRLDEVPHIFSKMKPYPNSQAAVELLIKCFDCYILSTSPWENPTAASDKQNWIKKYYPKIFHKRMILSHRKDLLMGDYLIDDRDARGAKDFEGEWIHFGSEQFPNWNTVVSYILAREGISDEESLRKHIAEVEQERMLEKVSAIGEEEFQRGIEDTPEEDLIIFNSRMTRSWVHQQGDYLIWAGLQGGMYCNSNSYDINDIWELHDRDFVCVTNRREDFPSWFKIHPMEAKGSLVRWMVDQLNNGYNVPFPMDGPNIWRVKAGDRIARVRINDRESDPAKCILTMIDFHENALVYGESDNPATDSMLFGSFDTDNPRTGAYKVCQAGFNALKDLGPPRVIDVDFQWKVG